MTHNSRHRCAPPRGAAVLALLLAAAPASARMVRDLYTVQEPVAGQDVAERLAAFRTGLAEVFVRVSGDAAAAGNAKLQTALQDPARFVLEYRYAQAPAASAAASATASGAPPAAPAASQASSAAPGAPSAASPASATAGKAVAPAPTLQLWMRFDPDAVRGALQQAGLPVWGSARPTTLLWIAVQDGLQRSILAEDEQSPLEQTLLQAATARGIPVLLPLMDLEDVRQVSFGDLWGGFAAPVRAASQRYGTHAILVGRVRHRAGGAWAGRWTLYVGDRAVRWRTQGASEAQLLTSGIDGLADRLAGQFAVPAGETARNLLRVDVDGVTSLADFARVRAYLSRLNPVLHVVTLGVGADRARFRLEVQGDAAVLEQAIGLGRTLSPAAPGGPAATPPAAAPSTGAPSAPPAPAGTPSATSTPTGAVPAAPASATQPATLVYRLVP